MIRDLVSSKSLVWWLQEAVKYACVPVLVGAWLVLLAVLLGGN